MSGLSLLKSILARKAPAQAETILSALRRTAQTGNETSVVGASLQVHPALRSRIVEGTPDTVTPDINDTLRARFSGQPIADFHTHPGVTAFSVRPSQADLEGFSTVKPAEHWWNDRRFKPGENLPELRLMIATPNSGYPFPRPLVYPDVRTASMYFGTGDPAVTLSPTAYESARYELQRGLSKGRLGDYMSNPSIRAAVEEGVDMADMVGDMSPLAMMRHYDVNRGLAKSEINLGDVALSDKSGLVDTDLFEFFTPKMLELLKGKKLASGGLVMGTTR